MLTSVFVLKRLFCSIELPYSSEIVVQPSLTQGLDAHKLTSVASRTDLMACISPVEGGTRL